MFNVSSVIYGRVAEIILDRIGPSDYLRESFEFECEGVVCRMLFSGVLYRKRLYLPEGEFDAIDDIVPVWWEFHTFNQQGEILNDFSFTELRNYLK
jgi:hypothetical protein